MGEDAPHCTGLVNQGATCYLNSLLQTLYHLSVFRERVFELPSDEDRVLTALQILFWNMETSRMAVSTEALTESFGWDSYESYKQHDVQELLQVLVSNKIEACFKKYLPEGNVVRDFFTGKFSSYIKVTEPGVDYENSVDEAYTDIQLEIKNFTGTCNETLEDCIRSFQVEDKLTGANQYELEKDGGKSLHDAVKGMCIKTLPDILFLHLKRFRQDMYGRAEKVTEPLSYGSELDMSKFTPGEDNVFSLFAVLVHKGSSATFGHYYSFVNLGMQKWVKFDDSRVAEATPREAIENNFGGSSYYGHGHAYMLVYIRTSKVQDVLYPPLTDRAVMQKKNLAAKAKDDDVVRSPQSYNKIYVVRKEDVDYALQNSPADVEQFLKEVVKGPTATVVNQKKNGVVSELFDLVSETTGIETGLLKVSTLVLTRQNASLVEMCHTPVSGQVFYINEEPLAADNYGSYTFIAKFDPDVKKLSLLTVSPKNRQIYECNEVTALHSPAVAFNLSAEPVTGMSSLITVAATDGDTRFQTHQKENRDKGIVVVKGPDGVETVIEFSKSREIELLHDMRVLGGVVAGKLGLEPGNVRALKEGTAPAKYSWGHKEFVDEMEVGKKKVFPKEVHIYADPVTPLGVYTLYVTENFRIDVLELFEAVEQLPQDVLDKLPDGDLLLIIEKSNEIDSIHRERTYSDYGSTMRIQPCPVQTGLSPIAVSHQDRKTTIPLPIMAWFTEDATPTTALAELKKMYYGGKNCETEEVDLRQFTRVSKPLRERNPAYEKKVVAPWLSGEDASSKWELAQGGYTVKALPDEPLVKQLYESYKGYRSMVLCHEKKKSKNQGVVIAS